MDRPLISVIIPCYNAQDTLEAAVYSALDQGVKEIEVIIVDDGSTDWSFVKAHMIADAEPRVRVIAMATNSGPSLARNKGIEEARGSYITFLDADDIYSEGLFKKIKKLVAGKYDVITWGALEEYIDADGHISRTRQLTHKDTPLESEAAVRGRVLDLEELSLYGYLWNKAYRAELIKDIKIPVQTFNEDEMFNIEVFNHVGSAYILDFAGTHYRKGAAGSLTSSELFDYYPLAMKRVAGLMNQQKAWGLYDDAAERRIADIYLRYMLSAIERTYHPALGNNERTRLLFMQRVFCSKLYQEMERAFAPGNPVLRHLAAALRDKDAAAALKVGKHIYKLKMNFPTLFEKLKG